MYPIVLFYFILHIFYFDACSLKGVVMIEEFSFPPIHALHHCTFQSLSVPSYPSLKYIVVLSTNLTVTYTESYCLYVGV